MHACSAGVNRNGTIVLRILGAPKGPKGRNFLPCFGCRVFVQQLDPKRNGFPRNKERTMAWYPYKGERYLSFDEVASWCHDVAKTHPEFLQLEVVGQSRHGRPLLLLTLSLAPSPTDVPAMWLDGGTHASEWTSVMSALHTLTTWIEQAKDHTHPTHEWLKRNTLYVLPCISPDGYQAMFDGAPYLRSTLRPPPEGTERFGLHPTDINGDGAIRWMRWKDPAGAFVPDEEVPIMMRHRRLDDDPSEAYFFCAEGEFLQWDGVQWVMAPREFGLDLNRNYPGHWAPFRMFGMDGGPLPLSAPESRAVMDAIRSRPNIALALSNHTYTGAILTQPYRADTPLGDEDILLMEALAEDAVAHTGYKVYRVHPAFTYDPKAAIVGVWSDSVSTLLGIPSYTLELWDPYGHCDVEMKSPAEFFRHPDMGKLRKMLQRFSEMPGAVIPWASFVHPQLGDVELGGIDYQHTFRNPPVSLLAAECDKGTTVAQQAARALPKIEVNVTTETLAEGLSRVTLVVSNQGFLSTASMKRAEELDLVPPCSATLVLDEGQVQLDPRATRILGHLDGWGHTRVKTGRHPVYASLPYRGHKQHTSWLVKGKGKAHIQWQAGRGGKGTTRFSI